MRILHIQEDENYNPYLGFNNQTETLYNKMAINNDQVNVLDQFSYSVVFNPFTPDSAKSKIANTFSKITNWIKLKNRH